MKLHKPSWVHHDDKPIFSVDVHQECLKFATGGQGLDSGRVVIWNLLPVISEKAELDETVPKILCQMDNHLACVNCVRWSQNGHMLASCSDDKLIMIWRISKGSSGVFGTGGIQKNPESWKCIATLRGHAGDVLDVAWSPQDRWLASCSIDNSIIVWDVHALPTMISMLKGHTGLVKGVAWDPVGKFLASQSDDRSVKIWKTSDWTCSSTITEPFEECGGTTHILRLSWSPDGQYLVSAHAMNGGGPTAQIIEREGWKCDKDFVGHRKAVTCVRFHNSILQRQTPKTKKPQQYCCLAVGSRDRSLSVWMTALQRPLVVIHELFSDSVLDLSWGPEKRVLLACSGDGTVACLQFSETELGEPLSDDERNTLYQRIYGKNVTIQNGSGADLLIENAELLNCTNGGNIKPPTLPTIQVSNTNTNHNNNTIETNTTKLPANGFGITKSSLLPSVPPATQLASCAATESGSSPMKAISKQVETRTVDGKRRITPVFIPLNQDISESATPLLSSSSRPMTITSTASATTVTTCSTVISDDNTMSEDNTISKDTAKSSIETKSIITEAEEWRLDSRLIMSTKAKLQPLQPNQDAIKRFPQCTTTKPKAPESATTSGPILNSGTAYQASTAGPKINITATTKCEYQKTAMEYRIHVHNGCVQTAKGMLAKVTAFSVVLGEKLWEMFVGSPIVNLNFCTKCVMLCSLDGTMRLLNLQTGMPILPIITLTTMAIQCAFCPLGKLVGVITDCGILRIWDIEKECIFLATTCTEIFGKFGTIVQFTITTQGVPLILFSSGNCYSYSPQLQAWIVLNTKDPIMRHGLQTTMPREFTKNYQHYPLTSIQASTDSSYLPNIDSIDLNPKDWQSSAKISFIENQIKICEAINSVEELKHWYAMLAYHLALSGTEKRLRLFLDDLLGPQAHGFSIQRPTTTPADEPKILSIPKHKLLESALKILKSHIKWQRIYMEYSELFENCNSIEKTKNCDVGSVDENEAEDSDTIAVNLRMKSNNDKVDAMDTDTRL